MAANQNQAHNRLFRSVIHATVSTWSGCQAKTAATNAAGQKAPARRRSTRKSRATLAEWKKTLTRWCAPAFTPNHSQSSMWESHASGCQ
jgi:hypothetical protein